MLSVFIVISLHDVELNIVDGTHYRRTWFSAFLQTSKRSTHIRPQPVSRHVATRKNGLSEQAIEALNSLRCDQSNKWKIWIPEKCERIIFQHMQLKLWTRTNLSKEENEIRKCLARAASGRLATECEGVWSHQCRYPSRAHILQQSVSDKRAFRVNVLDEQPGLIC